MLRRLRRLSLTPRLDQVLQRLDELGAKATATPTVTATATPTPGPQTLTLDVGPAASYTELALHPELTLDTTVDADCAQLVRDDYEHSDGSDLEVARQEEALEIALALPFRYMTDPILSALRYRMEDDDVERVCASSARAIEAFIQVRDWNPMGEFREAALRGWWACNYAGDGYRLLNDGNSAPDEDDCTGLIAWIPLTWVPPR